MYHGELVHAVQARHLDISTVQVERVLESLFQIITDELAIHDVARINEFGVFSVEYRYPKVLFKNTPSGKPIMTKGKYLVNFRPVDSLADMIQRTEEAESLESSIKQQEMSRIDIGDDT